MSPDEYDALARNRPDLKLPLFQYLNPVAKRKALDNDVNVIVARRTAVLLSRESWQTQVQAGVPNYFETEADII